jgi:hypothetical protein
MDLENALTHSQVPATCPYPELGTAITDAYFQYNGLPGCFAVETSNFAITTLLI